MECNKEEALRARDIAEQKMNNKEFIGAKKILLKAQKLFPTLGCISQMLTVCEVHCSAEVKVNGETDWYRILQVEPTADESYMKKQYRKLALLLHPDKNKFGGAEAAFKLIGEAHMTLSDPIKRSVYDNKRKSIIRRQPTKQTNATTFRKQAWMPTNISSNGTAHVNGLKQQQQQPRFSGSADTFWTMCTICFVKSQFYIDILGKYIRCPGCSNTFAALDINAQTVPSRENHGYSSKQSGAPQQQFPGPHVHNAGHHSHPGNAFPDTRFQGNMCGSFTRPQPTSVPGTNVKLNGSPNKTVDDKVAKEAGVGKVKFEKVKVEGANKRGKTKPSAGSTSRKRARKTIESSNSDISDSDCADSEGIDEDSNHEDQNDGLTGSCYPRRSVRQKRNVIHDEDGKGGCVDDNDANEFVASSSKKLRKEGSSFDVGQSGKNISGSDGMHIKVQTSGASFADKIDKQKGTLPQEHMQNGNKPMNKSKVHDSEGMAGCKDVKAKTASFSTAESSVDSTLKASVDLGSFSYPDPEFYDFEKDKDKNQFAVGQVWAVYDDLDGMPRFYALIRTVHYPDFMVRYTWLEHSPRDETESAWSQEELPIACGNYRLGKSKSTQDRLLFSHLMSWGKGMKRNSFNIYPRKGEVWALFKGWNASWISDADSHRIYEYEIVEVLSDFDEASGVCAIHLVRVKGFVCLFMQAEDKGTATLAISPGEVLRFSHRVPSYRLTGEEREGIPQGSLELDSTALPADFEKAFPAVSLDEYGSYGLKCSTDARKLETGIVS